MAAKVYEIASAYEEGLRLKEIARKSADDVESYLQAAEYLNAAGRMSADAALDEPDFNLKIQHEVFSSYYFYEENDCLSGYYYEKRDTEAARRYAEQSRRYIEAVIYTVEHIPSEVLAPVREFLYNLLPDWRRFQQTLAIKQLAIEARETWDQNRVVETLGIYSKMARLKKAEVAGLDERIQPAHYLAVGNFVRFMSATSSIVARLMLAQSEAHTPSASAKIPFATLVEILQHTTDAYYLGNEAFNDNPKWQQYYDHAQDCLRNIEKILKSDPSLWGRLFLAFEDKPEFLIIMKTTDLNKYKEVARKLQFRKSKLVKAWGIGSFSIILLAAASIFLLSKSSNSAWWQALLVILLIEAVLILIGIFTMRIIGDLSESNSLELVMMALRHQFGFFMPIKRINPSKADD